MQAGTSPSRARWIGLLLAVSLAACSKKRESASAPALRPAAEVADVASPDRATGASSAPSAASAAGVSPVGLVAQRPAAFDGCALVAEPLRVPGGKRIVAIGDVHGDFTAVAAALRAAGAVDGAGGWSGGDLIVVQTGDILDRGNDEQQILDWMERLEGEAKAAGGALYWLLGNHELMNGAGDFRYVTDGGYRDFEDVAGLDRAAVARAPASAQARAAAFLAQLAGPYAKVLAGQPTVLIVGDTVFSHAGVIEEWVDRLDGVNLENRCWLSGQLPARGTSALLDDGSPVWTRAWGYAPADCAALRRVLGQLGAARMVVGHTPQLEGISSDCDGALWRIDVGMSAHYGGPVQVLELRDGAARALAAAKAEPQPGAPRSLRAPR